MANVTSKKGVHTFGSTRKSEGSEGSDDTEDILSKDTGDLSGIWIWAEELQTSTSRDHSLLLPNSRKVS